MPDDIVSFRSRADGSTELRVNGVFVMDDVETTSERRIAEVALDHGARDILVGGLGLGFTARRLLESRAVSTVLVAELHAEVVDAVPIADPRAHVLVGDVREVVEASDSRFDAIVLDVDNGPDFLVHDQNTCLYRKTFIADCRRALRTGGLLAIWSMSASATLQNALGEHFASVATERIGVTLQGREESYFIFTAH
jgi:spermidine synthase